jgi:hypothetical protein
LIAVFNAFHIFIVHNNWCRFQFHDPFSGWDLKQLADKLRGDDLNVPFVSPFQDTDATMAPSLYNLPHLLRRTS